MLAACAQVRTWQDDHRQEAMLKADLLSEISGLLGENNLPMLEEFPPYLQRHIEAVVALRSGQKSVFFSNFQASAKEYRDEVWNLTQQTQDPSLEPAALQNVRAQMKVGVWSASIFTSPPTQLDLENQRAQLEYLHLSMGQLARIASMGMDLFEQLRALSFNEGDGAERATSRLSLQRSRKGVISFAQDPRLQAVGRCILRCQAQLLDEEWLSCEQIMRRQGGKYRHEPMTTNLHSMLLLLVDTIMKPSVPRLPSPHPSHDSVDQQSPGRRSHDSLAARPCPPLSEAMAETPLCPSERHSQEYQSAPSNDAPVQHESPSAALHHRPSTTTNVTETLRAQQQRGADQLAPTQARPTAGGMTRAVRNEQGDCHEHLRSQAEQFAALPWTSINPGNMVPHGITNFLGV
ncbi:hypothetical protein WJX73_001611 [Symbiochloris irregularis]|uniref:Uncharacterized protein n=1 Tax=Symbiochloris irregularis TaxID=706552 RepID=A0AAW1PQZ1_9CHLO